MAQHLPTTVWFGLISKTFIFPLHRKFFFLENIYFITVNHRDKSFLILKINILVLLEHHVSNTKIYCVFITKLRKY